MACSAIRTWTFTKLIGAFLDLSIAYMMLCGSTIAYFVSKFLGLFGLNLPCPCNGLFGNPNEAYCMQRFLVEYPVGRISSVHSSVKNKFPYDLICGVEQNCQGRMNKCISFDDRPLELEGEASCSSVSDARKPCDSTGWELVPKDVASVRAARIDLKRKGIAYQRPKSGLRRRRKVDSDYGTLSSAASYDPRGYDLQETPKSSFNFHTPINGEHVAQDDFIATTNTEVSGKDKDLAVNYWPDEVPQTSRLDFSLSKCRIDIEDGSVPEEICSSDKEDGKFVVQKENDINALEHALKEEKAARNALYIELEKERNAAATAADEAMGMILRLQEEKASIETQARQYQRMIEEKSAYDAEEMNLLKEILLRRERETYVMEKEVENYKRIILGGEQSGKGVCETQEEYGQNESSTLDTDDDLYMMLHEISDSIMKKENIERKSKILSPDILPVELQFDTSSNVDHDNQAKSKLHDYETVQEKVVLVNEELPNEFVVSQPNMQHVEKQVAAEDEIVHEEADSSKHDKYTHVVDVHVVGNDKFSLDSSSQNDESKEECIIQHKAVSNPSYTSKLDGQSEITRMCSDISSRSPPMVSKVELFCKEEGSSLSAIDFERLKIENEVELLRDKLKVVQEGRGKLNFSVEHNEGVKAQLQLLDKIANQLREMQLIRAPERSTQHDSAPSNPSKAETKKRRGRSLSPGLNNSL